MSTFLSRRIRVLRRFISIISLGLLLAACGGGGGGSGSGDGPVLDAAGNPCTLDSCTLG